MTRLIFPYLSLMQRHRSSPRTSGESSNSCCSFCFSKFSPRLFSLPPRQALFFFAGISIYSFSVGRRVCMCVSLVLHVCAWQSPSHACIYAQLYENTCMPVKLFLASRQEAAIASAAAVSSTGRQNELLLLLPLSDELNSRQHHRRPSFSKKKVSSLAFSGIGEPGGDLAVRTDCRTYSTPPSLPPLLF